MLFLPTRTGKNYLSKDEERDRESQNGGRNGGSIPLNTSREGGVDVVVEITKENELRVRARRCNYADNGVIKELSEQTILKRLQNAMEVWQKEHKL